LVNLLNHFQDKHLSIAPWLNICFVAYNLYESSLIDEIAIILVTLIPLFVVNIIITHYRRSLKLYQPLTQQQPVFIAPERPVQQTQDDLDPKTCGLPQRKLARQKLPQRQNLRRGNRLMIQLAPHRRNPESHLYDNFSG
jgi:hypothetical protein